MTNIEYYTTLLKLYHVSQEILESYAYSFREISFTQKEIICMNPNFTDYIFNQSKYEQLVTEEAIGLMKILNLELVEIKKEHDFENMKELYPIPK